MKIKKYLYILGFLALVYIIILISSSENVKAGSNNGEELANALLGDPSVLVSSSYSDKDESGCRQSIILEELGPIHPTNGSNFVLISTGIAGADIVTTNQQNPGCERGTWFEGGDEGWPRDEAILTMQLLVPPLAKYLKYDVKFLSSESPEWIGAGYNDKLKITVDAPSQTNPSTFILDVDSNLFREESRDLVGTGFDIFALDGNPNARDDVSKTLNSADDAGATITWAVEDEHPVLGPEIVTVTISIEDQGDNRYDSAAFLDNFRFEEEVEVSLDVRKEVRDLNEEEIEFIDTGEIIKYKIDIVNGGELELSNNYMIDNLSQYLTYVDNTLTAEYGNAEYHPAGNYITWEGDIPEKNYVRITFQAQVNDGVNNGTIISNQADTYWDTDNNGIPDSWTHSEKVNLTVLRYELPEYVTEDFSNDIPGLNASEYHNTRMWFNTELESYEESVFQVVSGYDYNTINSFKTKIRSSSGKIDWNYYLSDLDGQMDWWEIIFTCGNGSEEYDLILDFCDSTNDEIIRIKFEYIHVGTEIATDWVLKPYYYNSGNWVPLMNGFLYNNWYKLRVERDNSSNINYIIENTNGIELANINSNKLSGDISDFTKIRWYSNTEPIVCPMFFWDEHRVGLIPS